MELLVVLVVLGVLCVVAVNAIAPRLRVSAPLLLVVLGVLVSVQPFVATPVVEVDAEIVLAGVLPLLLFAAARSMPATSFRRNLSSITGLSITLVVISALTLGAMFSAMLPGLGLAGGIAMGAILSPTDAVATSIVKKLGVAPRVVALLDGEAMLNDASALVLLRAAIAASISAVSIRSVVGTFALSVVIATVIGSAVGHLTLRIRRRVAEATVNTLLSFAVPFIAYLPAEHLGASGLVAVVAAGLVIGQGAPRYLAPEHRINETLNWETIEMLLEGSVFLVMGLQLFPLLRDVRTSDASIGFAFALAGLALAITLGARAVWAVPLLGSARHRQRKYDASRARLEELDHDLVQTPAAKAALDKREAHHVARLQTRVRRVLADAKYVASRPLGVRDGVLLVWAGMRGAITLAAAQTLPPAMPHRSLLVLIAFLVATGSLLVQGGTLAWVIRRLRFPPPDRAELERENLALLAEAETAALTMLADPGLRRPDGTAYDPAVIERLRERVVRAANDSAATEVFGSVEGLLDRVFDAQRGAVMSAREDGVYSAEALGAALRRIDAMQLAFQIASSSRADAG